MNKLITLSEPLQRHGFLSKEEISILNLRRLRVKDIYGMDFSDHTKNTENYVVVISKLSGVPKSVLDGLSMYDFNQCVAAIGKMMSRGVEA